MSERKQLLRKIISVSLCAAMLCSTAAFAEIAGFAGSSLSGITANAAEETPASSFYYSENRQGGITIDKFKGSETDIVIPAEINGKPVTSIGSKAFYDCIGLTSITLPDSVTSIGQYAFSGCTGLTSVTLGNGVTNIEGYAFYGCTGLTSITIPDGVTSISWYAFYGCTGLKSVSLGNSVGSIGSYAFYDCIGLTSITIPDSVTNISNNSFEDCTGLTSIHLGEGVTNIGKNAFFGCTGLTALTIPDSVTSIGENAFYDCTGLESIDIGNGITSIEDYAFENYPHLKNITIGNGVTSIGKRAFYGCEKLTGITLPDSVTTIENNAFKDCTGLTSIQISENNSAYSSEDGVLFNKEKSELITCPGGKTGVYTIPDSVTHIGSYAFQNCTGLTSITIPDSVTNIEEEAFHGCSGLKSITIPDSVTSIGEYAFKGCTRLKSVTIAGSDTNIGYNAIPYGQGITVYGSKDSSAEKYAENNYLNFALLPLSNMSTIETTATVGEPIILNAIAEGGEGEYTYALMYKKSTSNTWTKIGKKYGTQSIGSFTPKSAVKYEIMINVKDSTGKVKSKTFTVDVKASLKNKTTVNAETVKVGEKIVLKGAASGGTSGYKYAFYYKKSKNSTWTEMKPAYTTKSAAFKPGSATSYDVKSIVKDAEGRTTEKVFTVKVTK